MTSASVVTAGSGYLTIHAHRSGISEGKHRSEFRYGSFTRTVTLPDMANPDDVSATYHDGILAVSVGVKTAQTDQAPRKIPVETAE